jgi:hypothetical protein
MLAHQIRVKMELHVIIFSLQLEATFARVPLDTQAQSVQRVIIF